MNNGRFDSREDFFDGIFDLFDDVTASIRGYAFPQKNPDWTTKTTVHAYTTDPSSIFEAVSKLPNSLVSAAYPPANVYIGKDLSYNLQIACAGYDDKSVSLEFDKDSLIVKFEGKSPFNLGDNCVLQKGIKNKEGDYSISFFIDIRKFDVEKLTSSIKNGLLEVAIPAIPNKKFKVGVGGEPIKASADADEDFVEKQ